MDAYGDLAAFGLGDMVRLSARMRDLSAGCASVVEFADRVCAHLHEHLVDPQGNRQTALVRFYGTVPFGALPAAEQEFATATWGRSADAVTCLTLLGTVGTEPEWNDRLLSRGHRVIPLTDAKQVEGLPMVAALLRQLGVNVEALLSASAMMLDDGQDRYGVFHVPRALGSDVIPAQDFVTTYGIGSVLGFGGALPSGEVYAVVVFATTEVRRESAQLFETVALSTTLAALEMLSTPIFPDDDEAGSAPRPISDLDGSGAREGLLRALLEVHERVAVSEASAARRALDRATHEATRYSGLARILQASLIPPKLASFPGVQTSAFYRPAGDGSEVGGDFYDLFPVRDEVWGLALGDVSGKGAGAAALTALARYTIRAAAFHAAAGVDVLAELDEALHRHDADERYLTAMFAVLRPTAGQLAIDLTLGGHPPPFVVRRSGVVESIGTPGSALGLLPDSDFTPTHHLLESGDALVAYTDGVTEARRGNEQYGDVRLRSMLSGVAGLSARTMASAVGEAVLSFQAGLAHDDTAVVVVRCD